MRHSNYLFDLIAEGEHQQQDFKYKIEDAPKLARSVSAFANTDGGRLLIGVRDDGTIHGVRSEEEIYMMHAAAYRYCTPTPTIQFETLHVPTEPHGGRLRTVVICTVLPSDDRPVFALEGETMTNGQPTHFARAKGETVDIARVKGETVDIARVKGETAQVMKPDTAAFSGRRVAYIRVADENIVASPVHLSIWRQEARLQGETYGDTPEEQALLAALATHPEGLTLNALQKAAHIHPRPLVIAYLARFIRFGLAHIMRHEQQWVFRNE